MGMWSVFSEFHYALMSPQPILACFREGARTWIGCTPPPTPVEALLAVKHYKDWGAVKHY